jgi:nucleoid-associated protein YejK
LQREDFKNYDLMTKGGKIDDKKFIYDYLGEDISDGKSLDGKALNKEYDQKLEKSVYQGFWQ